MAIDIRFGDSRIYNSFETVFLQLPSRQDVVIGDFYGDPSCAIVSKNQEWCVIGGEGLVVYFLREPFTSYARETLSLQWKDFFRRPFATYWIDQIEEQQPSTLLLRVEKNAEESRRVLLNIATGVEKEVD